jgi:hypothetical protein
VELFISKNFDEGPWEKYGEPEHFANFSDFMAPVDTKKGMTQELNITWTDSTVKLRV